MTSETQDRIRQRRANKMLPTPANAPQASSSSERVKGDINLTDFTVRIPNSTLRTSSGPGTGKGMGAGSGATSGTGPGPGPGPGIGSEEEPSRWSTTEFKVYAAVFVLVVPMMVYWPMRLSSTTHHNYPFYAYKLSPGWLSGRQVDNSDAQYSAFRNNVPGLLALGSLHLLSSFIHSRLSSSSSSASRSNFLAVLSVAVLVILHGTSAVKVLAILIANYRLCMLDKPGLVGKFWPGVLIVGNMLVLLMNERFGGYAFGSVHGVFAGLDEWSGLLPGWQNHFKITMLRIVSFGLDRHWWSASTPGSTDTPTDHRSRVNRSLPIEQYSLTNFLAYALYPPLYIAGPIMTFNDFTWQTLHPSPIPIREKLSYAIRFIFCMLTMESVLHTMYVVAIKDAHAWDGDSPADLSMIGFWNLVVVWLKLLIPWRFFRLWALLDGVDPPENMVRCVANNYSTLGFWRSWHRSYNLWIVRYIYIPVGGGRNAALSTLLVFTFVALWHDLTFKLLAWGWLVSLFILPELLARKVLSYEKYGHEPWYRHVAAVGGVGNILLMMSANLVGFVLGLEGMKHLVVQLSSTIEGWLFTAFSCVCFFVAVQVMFEYRAEERRRGIDRRC